MTTEEFTLTAFCAVFLLLTHFATYCVAYHRGFRASSSIWKPATQDIADTWEKAYGELQDLYFAAKLGKPPPGEKGKGGL